MLLGCAANGVEWLYPTRFGELFITSHIVQILMQGVMLERALYKIPHAHGWFENYTRHAELGSSDEEEEQEDLFAIAGTHGTTINEKDDHFQRVD